MVQTFTSQILAILPLTDSVKHFVISTPDNFAFKPGQFVSLILPIEGKEHRRPYSIASEPNDEDHISLCIKIIPEGVCTPTINTLTVGDTVKVLGPLGQFTLKEYDSSLFIATGTGITPFRSMIPELLKNTKKEVTLLTGHKTKNTALYSQEFLSLEKQFENFKYSCVLSQEEDKKHVQDILKEMDIKHKQIYICGLFPMIQEVLQILQEKNIPKEIIHFERYS